METNRSNIPTELRHDAMWSRNLLQQELRQLKREHEHLTSKAHERDLTHWELGRLETIADEVMGLLSEFTKTLSLKRAA